MSTKQLNRSMPPDEGREKPQQPRQADPKRSSTLWDTEQHSDAPGASGTAGLSPARDKRERLD